MGYNPSTDGNIKFTIKDVLVNSESNSMYGNFRLDIFDFFTAPILVVSGTYSSTQTISPLNMTFASFSFYPTTSTHSPTLLSSSYNTTVSLSFTLSYTAPP